MAKQHLLLVDSDAKSLRVMEVSLKKAGFSVTTAVNGRDALDKVQISPPDLVLSDTRMPEMDGFELCKTLKTDPRFEGVPFVFLTNQKSVEFKVKGLELGGDDYLTKPIYIKEIVTRLRMILQKAEKERLEKRETKSGFSGSLADMGVVDLVQTFEIGRKTGTISVTEDDRVGTVWFRDGRVIDAEMGHVKGEHAFYRMLNTFDGKFEVSFGLVDRPERIEMSTQGLLMEGMRRLDEWGRMLEQLPALDMVFEIDHRQLAQRLSEIPDEVNGILRLFDGTRSLAQVVDSSEFEDLAALGIISKLYFEGLIREVGSPPADGDAPARIRISRDEWLKGTAVLSRDEPAADNFGLDEFGVDEAVSSAAVQPTLLPSESVAAHAAGRDPVAPPLTPPAQVITFAARSRGTPALAPEALPVLTPASEAGPAGTAQRALEQARTRLLLDWGREVDEGIVGEPGWGWAPLGRGAATGQAPQNGSASSRRLTLSTEGFFSEEDVLSGRGFFKEGNGLSSPPASSGNGAEAPATQVAARKAQPAGAVLGYPVGEVIPLPDSPPAEPTPATPASPPSVPQSASPQDSAAAGAEGGAPPALPPYPGHGVPPKEPSTEDAFLDALPPLGPDVFESVPRRRTGLFVGVALVGIAAAALVGFAVTRTGDAHGGRAAAAARPVAGAGPNERTGPPPRAPDSVATAAVKESGREAPPITGASTATPGARGDSGAAKKAGVSSKPPSDPQADGTKPGSGSDQSGAPVGPSVAVATASAGAEGATDVAPQARPDDAEYSSLVATGRAAIAEEKFKKAVNIFRKALALKPDSVEAKAGLGVALVGSDAGDSSYREAIGLLNEVVKQDGGNARAWLALGLAYQMLGRDKQAVGPYRKYLALEPRGRFADDVRSALNLIRE